MSKLDELFKTKEQIEREIEAERQAKYNKEQEIAQEKYRKEAREREHSLDMTFFTSIKGAYIDKLTALFPQGVTTNQMLYIIFAIAYVNRNFLDIREVNSVIESLARVFKEENIK